MGGRNCGSSRAIQALDSSGVRMVRERERRSAIKKANMLAKGIAMSML